MEIHSLSQYKGARGSFILPQYILQRGVITHFYAMLLTTDPLILQIYRKMFDHTYKVIGEKQVQRDNVPAMIEVSNSRI